MRVLVNEEQEVAGLLEMVDPYNNQKMTYSEIVHLLSSHMVPAGQEDFGRQTTSILEKFVNIRTGGSYQELRGPLLNSNSRKSGGGGGQEDIRKMIVGMNEEQNYEQDGNPYGYEDDEYQ